MCVDAGTCAYDGIFYFYFILFLYFCFELQTRLQISSPSGQQVPGVLLYSAPDTSITDTPPACPNTQLGSGDQNSFFILERQVLYPLSHLLNLHLLLIKIYFANHKLTFLLFVIQWFFIIFLKLYCSYYQCLIPEYFHHPKPKSYIYLKPFFH